MKVEFTKGNKKLPKSTYIINMGSATDCPSKKLGLCQCPDKCYALAAERQYPDCKPFRERQREVFNTVSAKDIAAALILASKRSGLYKMTHLRFSEAGDFETQSDVVKLAEVCRIVSATGVSVYGYTARTDLDLSSLLKVATVNVSNDAGDHVDNGANRFKAVETYTNTLPKCAGDCRICSLCSTVNGKVIEVELH